MNKTLSLSRPLLCAPGWYHLPRLLSLIVILGALLALVAWQGGGLASVPPPLSSLSFLLLGFSLRLARWDRVEMEGEGQVRVARVASAAAALLALADSLMLPDVPEAKLTSFLVAVVHSLLSAVLLMAMHGRMRFARRVCLVGAVIVSLWLVTIQAYGADEHVSRYLKSDAPSALLALLLTAAFGLFEFRAGLGQGGVSNWLGTGQSILLLGASVAIPLLLGFFRIIVEAQWAVPAKLLLALHVVATMLCLAPVLIYLLRSARERYESQLRTEVDWAAAERTYAEIAKQAEEFCLVLDPDGLVRHANESARRILDLDSRRGQFHEFSQLLSPDSRYRLASAGRDLLRAIEATPVLSFQTRADQHLPVFVAAVGRRCEGKADQILVFGRSLPLGLRGADADQGLWPTGS